MRRRGDRWVVGRVKGAMHAVFKTIEFVGVHLGAVHRCDTVSPLKNRIKRPQLALCSSVAPAPWGVIPVHHNRLILMDCVIANEVHAREELHRTGLVVGKVDKNIHVRSGGIPGEMHANLFFV